MSDESRNPKRRSSDQRTWQPSRPVTAGSGLGIPLGIVICWALQEFAGVHVPAEVGSAIGSMCTGLIAYSVHHE